MIKRYFSALAAVFYTRYISNVEQSHTATTITFLTVVNGFPSATVTFKVTSYSASDPSAVYKVNGTTHVLNDTFDVTLDGSGNTTLTQFLDVGSGTAIDITLTIFGVTKGLIGVPSAQRNEYVP